MSDSSVIDFKTKGNDAMKEKKYWEAVLHYTQGTKLEPNNKILYSNRSLAFQKLESYYLARVDALKTIELDPKWTKGYARKAESEFHAEHYYEAMMSYRHGLECDQSDEKLLNGYSEAHRAYKQQLKKEKNMPIYGAFLGSAVGLLVVLLDVVFTEKPVLKYFILQVLTIGAFLGVGLLVAMAFRYLQRSQRRSMLEEPADLMPGLGGPSKPVNKENSTKKADKKDKRTKR